MAGALCIASVTPRKGHAVLIEALAGLADRAWELHNVGSLAMDPAAVQAVQAMPVFPNKGYCQLVDGVMVIRLSE